jgi:putative copper resistance protein D
MQGFAEVLDGLLSGTVLLALALAVGGVVWGLAVVRPWRGGVPDRVLGRAIVVMAAGAAALAVAQAATLGVTLLLLSQYAGPDVFASFTTTVQFRAGSTRAALAIALAACALRLRARPTDVGRWAVAALLAAAVTVTGAFLVHAVGRLEQRGVLMALTILHQLGAAVWVGGLVQLLALWGLARRDDGVAAAWPELVARFSRVAVISLILLLASAAPLVVLYVGSWTGLVGTSYGSLVVAKVALLGAVLLLAAFNFRVARRRTRASADAVRRRLPYLAEAEMILLVVVLFTAASLSSQPPPIDGTAERATWEELVEVFRPKWPSLRTPSVAAKLEDASKPPLLDEARTNVAYSWSNFSHNVAGLLLLGMGLVAVAGWVREPWARHWPLGLVALAVFVFLRTSASEGTWPFGPTGVWENALASAEALQHRIGAGLALALGLLEWRARAVPTVRTARLYVFPVLAAVGGVLLVAHSHTAFEPKSSYLVQVTHTAMGALAVIMACGRWLELRLGPPLGRAGGAASTVAMLLIALVLIFYREANVVVVPAE